MGLLLRNLRPLIGAPSEDPLDLRVRDGRIAEVGALEPDGDEVVDCAGRPVVPGLVDHHTHVTHWAGVKRRFDLAAAGSAAEAAALAARELDGGAREAVGFGFRDALWAEPPTVAVLDAATGQRPAVLVAADLHCVWLNSAALRRRGLAPVPGVLREEAAFAVLRGLDDVDAATSDAWVREALQAAAARGVTRIVDLEFAWNLESWARRAASWALPTRVDFGIYPRDLERAIGMGLRTGQVIAGTQGRVRVGPLKVITDGSLNTRTAWCVDAYPGMTGADAHGVASVAPQDLTRLLARAAGNGLSVAVHAIGDRANQAALDAFAATGARGSIEHAQLLRVADIPRFAALGVVASVQPEHAMDDRDVAERYWAGRTGRSFVLRGLLDAGARLAFGSDAPVAPLDPWVAIAAAVTRARGGRGAWHPEQALSLGEALAASVEGVRISPGAVADLAILDDDPREASGERLRQLAVAGTLVAGAWSHRDAGLGA